MSYYISVDKDDPLSLGRCIAMMHGVVVEDIRMTKPQNGESMVFKVYGRPEPDTPDADMGLDVSAEFSVHWRDL